MIKHKSCLFSTWELELSTSFSLDSYQTSFCYHTLFTGVVIFTLQLRPVLFLFSSSLFAMCSFFEFEGGQLKAVALCCMFGLVKSQEWKFYYLVYSRISLNLPTTAELIDTFIDLVMLYPMF